MTCPKITPASRDRTGNSALAKAQGFMSPLLTRKVSFLYLIGPEKKDKVHACFVTQSSQPRA